MSSIPLSIPWYETEDDFKAILDLIPFEESKTFVRYSEWTKRIKRLENEKQQEGFTPLRITIKPESIKMWRQTNDVLISRSSIADFALKKMIENFHK
jgi:hypothetical protein